MKLFFLFFTCSTLVFLIIKLYFDFFTSSTPVFWLWNFIYFHFINFSRAVPQKERSGMWRRGPWSSVLGTTTLRHIPLDIRQAICHYFTHPENEEGKERSVSVKIKHIKIKRREEGERKSLYHTTEKISYMLPFIIPHLENEEGKERSDLKIK